MMLNAYYVAQVGLVNELDDIKKCVQCSKIINASSHSNPNLLHLANVIDCCFIFFIPDSYVFYYSKLNSLHELY